MGVYCLGLIYGIIYLFPEHPEVNLIKGQVPEEWRFGEAEQDMWIELDIDDTLSGEKVQKCADDFKEYVLKTFISILND